MYTKRYTYAIRKESMELGNAIPFYVVQYLKNKKWSTCVQLINKRHKPKPYTHPFICIVHTWGSSWTTVTHYPNSFHIPLQPISYTIPWTPYSTAGIPPLSLCNLTIISCFQCFPSIGGTLAPYHCFLDMGIRSDPRWSMTPLLPIHQWPLDYNGWSMHDCVL